MDTAFQELLGGYLRHNASKSAADAVTAHPDEDTLSVFAEGGLSDRELTPVVAHLSECGNCRGITTELIRLEMAMDETFAPPAASASAEGADLAATISNWFSRVFGTSDATVFAHSEDDESKEKDQDKDSD